jgi:hypothetical protein
MNEVLSILDKLIESEEKQEWNVNFVN